ncbi:MAG: hypothetical protein M1286_02820 [Candidatus Marsarchaeota archaeon]|nr:hypothetical protein [Candidatus Marsarchaeota archaeon]
MKMLKKIAAYEKRVFSSDAIPLSRMIELWKKNPFMFTALRSGNKFLGYFDIFVPNEPGEKVLRERNGIDQKLSAEHMRDPQSMRGTKMIYFDAIGAVGSGESRKRIAAMLMYGRATFVQRRFRLPSTIYVIPTTPEGKKLVKSYGGARFAKASISHTVYWMFKLRATASWCKKVKARAAKRAVPKIAFARV